jgi:mRNA-degrading endonuclease YafQ of YafQ-DinJ toxin-antitoxin module
MEFIYTKKFSKAVKIRVRERLTIFSVNENDLVLNNHKLNPPWDGYRSINVTGDVRIIYKKEKNFFVLYRIGTHPQLYS